MKFELRTDKRLGPGRPEPRGTSAEEDGVNFSIFSEHADKAVLYLYDSPDSFPSDIIPLVNRTGPVRHVKVYGIKPGQLYAYRLAGPFDPAKGFWFNENKLLLDPYAKAFTSPVRDNSGFLRGALWDQNKKQWMKEKTDSEIYMPKCVATAADFDWQGAESIRPALEDLIIYEVHVRGFTAHDTSKVECPGTYAGFIEKIPYLLSLGINAVELLPVHESVTAYHLARKGLINYWGYDTAGFFAPSSFYAADQKPGAAVKEFKTLVRECHKAGIAVILDVVFNHTGEGNEHGPQVCFRGIDHPSYYALEKDHKTGNLICRNDAGTGNMLDIEKPEVLRLVLDSLRYWVQEMKVDGFRFDLAPIPGRKKGKFDPDAAFFKAVRKESAFQNTLLIAEPWDLKTYALGGFPPGWLEWNDRYRDTLRRFLRGDKGQAADLGWRICGSEDVFRHNGRLPGNSVNFITCHDGFTLYDLYSYEKKYNAANGENNRDGHPHNYSTNCGKEGETDDEHILALRRRMCRNALCALFLSLGTPMLNGGDEMLRTQKGNNNAYCQDNEMAWLNWDFAEKNAEIVNLVRGLAELRRRWPELKGRHFLRGSESGNPENADIQWFGENGIGPDWHNPETDFLYYILKGGQGKKPYRLCIGWNFGTQVRKMVLPEKKETQWIRILDTDGDPSLIWPANGAPVIGKPEYLIKPLSIVLMLQTAKQV